MFAGSLLICVTSFLDYLEHTPFGDFIIAGLPDTVTLLTIITVLGYVPGILLMLAGVTRWFGLAIRLEKEIALRRATENTLHERTRQLSVALMEAQQANRAKTRFLANMSHEIRTPLNAIIGFSEMMNLRVFGELDDQYQEYAQMIHASGELLLDIINDILDLSKVEAGHFELDESEISLRACAEECLSIIEPSATANGVSTRLKLEAEPVILADRRVTKQMILNLLSNSVKFTKSGGTIDLTVSMNEEGCPCVAVKDTGTGMTNAEMEIALQPFGQIEGVLTRRNRGTGLGLALVVTFIELHGGKLILKSEKGKGTEVSLTFPSDRIVL